MAPTDPTDPGEFQHESPDAAGGNGGVHPTGGMLAPISGNNLPSVANLNWSYGPPPKPEILSAKPNPFELWHALRRRWPLALGLGITVSTIAAGLLWYFMPVKYEAFALLQVSGAVPSVLDDGKTGQEEFAVFKRTQVQLILSNVVMTDVLRDSNINRLGTIQEHPDDPVAWLRSQLVIDYPNDAEVMRISMKAESPSDAIKIVDAVVASYMEEIVEAEKAQRVNDEAQLQKAFEKHAADHTAQMKSLQSLAQIHGTEDSEEAQIKKQLAMDDLNIALRNRQGIIDQITNNDVEIMMAQSRQEHPEHAQPPDALIEAELAADPVIRELTQQHGGYMDYLNQIRGEFVTNDHDYLRDIQRRALLLEEQIEERKAELRPRLLEMLVAAALKKKEELHPLSIEQLTVKKDYLAKQLEQINEEVKEKSEKLAKMESFSAEVAAKQEELEQSRIMKNELGARLDRLRIEKLAPERIEVIDRAILENSRGDKMRKYIGVVFAGILSFSLVLLGVAVIEFQSRKVNSVEEVNDGLGIRVMGELPSISGRAFRRIRGGKGPAVLKALMAERIDGTRTALIHTTATDPPRVVMVTSAEPHEGKTTTSSQLAASLARSGRRTLLIDADIRNPGVHRVFELPQDPGLSELLRGESERDAVIHPTRTANLWLMPAGRCDLRSVQALSSSFLGTTIAALSVQFDYVIIDAGPVLKVTDPLLIGQHVDAAIVSVLRDVSKVPRLYEAVERLRSVGINVLGSVVNGVKDDVARHGVELLMAAETPKKNQDEPSETSETPS